MMIVKWMMSPAARAALGVMTKDVPAVKALTRSVTTLVAERSVSKITLLAVTEEFVTVIAVTEAVVQVRSPVWAVPVAKVGVVLV